PCPPHDLLPICLGGAGLIRAYLGAERDREAVPAVDGDDGERQADQLRFAEVLTRAGVELVRDVVGRNQRQRLGPLQRGTLARRVERRLLPRRQAVQAL